MLIVSVSTDLSDPVRASEELFAKLTKESGATDSPQLLAVFGKPDVIEDRLLNELAPKLEGCAIHGATSSKGVISTDWTEDAPIPTLGALAIYDAEGDYGSASADLTGDAQKIASQTTERALRAAGREGEAPELLLISCAPGKEERVLSGVRSVVGAGTQVIGASSADDTLSGNWAQFSAEGLHADGVVISVIFPSCSVTTAHDCAYSATPSNGLVTSSSDRRIVAIDGEPAARVYSRWTGVPLALTVDDKFCEQALENGAVAPLGRVIDHTADFPEYALIRPVRVYEDGSLGVMADVIDGERLWCMKGEKEQLLSRVAPLTELASFGHDEPPKGGLVVLCATPTLTDDATMRNLAQELRSNLGGMPSLAVFSFGEQWMKENGDLAHANQMMLCAMFR